MDNEVEFVLDVIGNRTLLLNNGQMSDPLNPVAIELKSVASKRKKTNDDERQMAVIGAYASIYMVDGFEAGAVDTSLAIPSQFAWSCIYNAAKAYKRGEDIKRALHSLDDIYVPLSVNGVYVDGPDYASRPQNWLRVPVRVRNARVPRTRVKVDGWAARFKFSLDSSVMDLRDLTPILERAGKMVGFGDWRPKYGTFDVRAVEV